MSFTAEEITEKYGIALLSHLYTGVQIKDHAGFTYTGRIEFPAPGQWYTWGGKPVQASQLLGYSGLVLTLDKIITQPRVVQYTLTAMKDVEIGEKLFVRSGNGLMCPFDPAFDDNDYVYTLRETE